MTTITSRFPMRVHWSVQCGGAPCEFERFAEDCNAAQAAGAESIEVPVCSTVSTALEWAVAAGSVCGNMRFRVGADFACLLDTLRGRDLAAAASALGGRLIMYLRIVDSCERGSASFCSAEEFLRNLRAACSKSCAPQFDVVGDSAAAAYLAIKQADCLWRTADRSAQAFADALPVFHFGKEVGLHCTVIARETREQAVDAAARILPERPAGAPEEQACWMTPALWRRIEPEEDEAMVSAMIGSYSEVAEAISGYGKNGISQFLVRTPEESSQLSRLTSRILPLLQDFAHRGQGV